MAIRTLADRRGTFVAPVGDEGIVWGGHVTTRGKYFEKSFWLLRSLAESPLRKVKSENG